MSLRRHRKTLDKIGKYQIIDKIGEGGFGVVYKGKDPFIKRLVAVKTCSSQNEAIQQRFFREAEIAGNLHHANVVTIHDFGIEEGTPYLVQEFLTGQDLDVVIKEASEQLTLGVKVRYLRGIAEGLSYAHAQGVIHRDIKPANIRILENQRVKVMDFGIAKLKDQESQLTQTGMTLGTVAYLSPEQLRGQNVDYRADIFSYGVLAYELICGLRPFRADTIHSLFYQLLNDNAQDLSDMDEEVPASLNEVIQLCLAKDPDDRFSNFSEVIAKLEEVQAEFGDSEENRSRDVFMPKTPGGAATTGTSLLAAKARNALESGDLTAAELTINMARREYSSEEDFQKHFADLEVEVASLKGERDNEISGNIAIGSDAAANSDSAQNAATLEKLPASAERKEQELPLIRMRIESLIQGNKRQEAEQELSQALAEFGPDTTFSDLSEQIRAASSETAGSSLLSQAGLPAEAATMQIDAETVKAAKNKAARTKAAKKQETSKASAAKASASPAPPALAPIPSPAPSPSPVEAPSFSEEPQAKNSPPIALIAAGLVAGLILIFVLMNLLDGGDTLPTDSVIAQAVPEPAADGRGARPTDQPTGETSEPSAQAAAGEAASADETNEGSSQRSPSEGTAPEVAEQTPTEIRSEARAERDRTPEPPRRLEATPVAPKPQRSQPQRSQPQREQPRSSTPSSTPARDATTPSSQAQSGATTPPNSSDFSMADMTAKANVRSAVGVYVAAWRSLDHKMVNDIFPSAALKRSDMRAYKSADVNVGDCDIQVGGNSAKALCSVTRILTPKRGDVENVRLGGFELTKSGGRWTISKEIR